MPKVVLKENEGLDDALRRFKRQCAMSGIMSEVRKREHYDKPSVKRKKKAGFSSLLLQHFLCGLRNQIK